MSWDSLVGIATGYDLHCRVISPVGPREALGHTESPIQWVSGNSFPGGKAAGA
jgi:hypothetical protein